MEWSNDPQTIIPQLVMTDIFTHSYVQPLCIKKIKEHVAQPTTYKKHDSNPRQAIRNGALPILDFFCSAHQAVHRARNGLTSPKSSLFYGLSKSIHHTPSPTKTFTYYTSSMAFPKSIYATFNFIISPPTNTTNMW